MLARRPLLGLLAGGAAPASASRWPERPLRLVVPVAPGGSQDIVARLLARHLAEPLGQNVVVENLPGGASNVGIEAVARARPDGQTLLAGSDALSINGALFRRLGFDPVADFAPVALAVLVPQLLATRADHPARDLAGFLALGRQRVLAVGTTGIGSLAHLLGELIQDAAGLRWTHVPYRGGAPAVGDLLGGSLDAVLVNIGAAADLVHAGSLRALAVSSAGRVGSLPAAPSLAEAGLPGLSVVGWHGLVAPAATPEEFRMTLYGMVQRILARPQVAERVAALGMEPGRDSPGELGARIRADATRWAGVIRAAGIQVN